MKKKMLLISTMIVISTLLFAGCNFVSLEPVLAPTSLRIDNSILEWDAPSYELDENMTMSFEVQWNSSPAVTRTYSGITATNFDLANRSGLPAQGVIIQIRVRAIVQHSTTSGIFTTSSNAVSSWATIDYTVI